MAGIACSCCNTEMVGSMKVKRTTQPAVIPIGEWNPERVQIEDLKAELKDTQAKCFKEWMQGIMFEREIMNLKEQLTQKNSQIARLKKNATNMKNVNK